MKISQRQLELLQLHAASQKEIHDDQQGQLVKLFNEEKMTQEDFSKEYRQLRDLFEIGLLIEALLNEEAHEVVEETQQDVWKARTL